MLMTDKDEHRRSGDLMTFRGEDFNEWKAQAEMSLRAKELWFVMEGTRPRRVIQGTPEQIEKADAAIARFDQADVQAKDILLNALNNRHAKLVLNCRLAKEMWARLVSVHDQRSAASLIIRQREFFEIRMKNPLPIT